MTRKLKVLVVDDDPAILELVSTILRLARVEVATAVDGEAGLALAHVTRPDVVLLDIMMPRMDGYDVCRALKASDDAPKIVMITAKTSSDDELAALAAGADGYIRKPFRPEDILRAVGREVTQDGRPAAGGTA
ncbi:MAG: response regulator transcription factor [Actinomycetota bacterium]